MIVFILGCSTKTPSHTYTIWDTSEQTYKIEITYQGTFRSNGSVQPDVFQNIDIDATCKGNASETTKQTLTCNMNIAPVFSGLVEAELKDNTIKNLRLPPNSQEVYDVISTAIGSILAPPTPMQCDTSQTYKEKKPQEHMRIPYLNGPSSHFHEYEILQCTPIHIAMQGKFTISAQSTENTSAPRFTFATTDQIQIDDNGYITTRNYNQSLVTSTTTLAPNSVYQSITVHKK